MNRYTRMFKTLGCLVVAMTSAAAWLAWIDPSGPLAPEIPSYRDILRSARSLVADGVDLDPARWHSVEIIAGPARADSGSFLAATTDRSECHFLINAPGQVSCTRRWPRQEASTRHPGTVRIQVARAGRDQPMSRAQWRSVQALITALREHAAAERTELPVRLHEEWARVYGLEPGTTLDIPSGARTLG